MTDRKAIKEFLGENFDVQRIDAAVVYSENKTMQKLSLEDIETSLK